MRTLKEKLEYNRKRKNKSSFATGYAMGVTLYENYPKMSTEEKVAAQSIMRDWREIARRKDRNDPEVQLSKGLMCGLRDSANERKKK